MSDRNRGRSVFHESPYSVTASGTLRWWPSGLRRGSLSNARMLRIESSSFEMLASASSSVPSPSVG